jgi:hypothetical protein
VIRIPQTIWQRRNKLSHKYNRSILVDVAIFDLEIGSLAISQASKSIIVVRPIIQMNECQEVDTLQFIFGVTNQLTKRRVAFHE